jgi:hypothetical protein
LNADLLDGFHASDFVRQSGGGGTGYMTNDNIPVGTERDLQFPNVDGTAPAFTTYPTTGSMPVKTIGTDGAVVEGTIDLNAGSVDIVGTLPYTNGGTGLSTLGTPLQVLRTNAGATAIEWAASAGGTVTDVTATAPIASTGGATPDISHNTSGVAAGAYINPNITVDDKGHVTAASSGGAGDYGSTGIITGGGLSIGTGGAGVATTFTIAAGTGKVVDPTTNPPTVTGVTWTDKTDVAITNLLTQLVTFVAIDSGGNVVQSNTLWTPAQTRDYIAIGVVVHSNLTTVNAVNQGQGPLQSLGNQFVDLNLSLGTFNITGNVFSANGANLKINKSAGSVFRQGANYTTLTDNPHVVTLGALTQASLRMQNQTGAG